MARNLKRLSLGTRIRRLREAKEINLETVGNETGFSVDYLKKIEADEVIPPVGVLLTLGRALEVDSGEFLRDDELPEASGNGDGDEDEAVKVRTDNYSYRVLTPAAAHRHLKGFLVTIDPGRDLEAASYQHDGEEFHYVLTGQVEVKVGDNVNLLEPGDSLHFNSSVVHKLRNTGEELASILVVLYTP